MKFFRSLLLSLLLPSIAFAGNATLTGTVLMVDGDPCVDCKVNVTSPTTQSVDGVTIPKGLQFSFKTTATGNVPTGTTLIQNSVIQLEVAGDLKSQVKVPNQPSVDMSELIANVYSQSGLSLVDCEGTNQCLQFDILSGSFMCMSDCGPTGAGGVAPDGTYGDITVSGGGTIVAINPNSIALGTDTTGLLPSSEGGTGLNSSGFTGVPYVLGGTWGLTQTGASLQTAMTDDTGTGGLMFANMPTLAGVPFTSLGASSSGTIAYCNNCTQANPCASGGSGAFAHKDGAVWNCGGGGGGGAPTTATYITQTPDATLSAEQAMSALGTGLTLNTTTTGVQSIYAGATCTNQFPRVQDASGAWTCQTVTSSYVDATIPTLAFKTIHPTVSGSDVVADSAADTLNLTAGTNVTLTTDASTDTVTIAATAGGAALLQVTDVTGASGLLARTFGNAAGTITRVEVWPQATDKPDEGAAATAGTIAWAEAQLTTGGEIFLHTGTYTVGTTIVMDVGGTTLRCADPQTTELKAKTNLNSIILKVGDFVGNTQRQGMQIMGCGFNGNAANQSTSGTLIAFRNTADARIEGNYIRYWKTLGLTMACSMTGTQCVDNMVARNDFYSSGGTGNTAGSAIFLDTNTADGAGTLLSDGHISDNDIGGDNSNGDRVSAWIRIGDGTTDDTTNGWSIQQNHIYGADRGACIEVADKTSSLIDISNNTLETCNVGAIKWRGNAAGAGGLSSIQNNKMYGYTGRCTAGTNPIGTSCAVATAVADCGTGGVCTLPNVIDLDRVLRMTVTGNRLQSQAGGVAAFIALRDSGALGGSNHNLIADNKMDWTGVSGEKGVTLANSSANNTVEGNQCRTNVGSNGTCVDGGSIGGNRFFSNSCVNTCAAVETGIAAYSATTIHDVNTSVGDVGDFSCTSGACTLDAGVVTSGKVDATVCTSGGTGCPVVAPVGAKYIVQTADATLTSEQAMGALGTGITFNTTGTGVQSIYPGSSCTNQFPRSVNSSGAWTCGTVASTDVDATVCTSGGTGCPSRAPTNASYITQVPDATLSAEQAMSLLGTGLILNTTTTGVQSIYAGSTCTNQFARSTNASGALTCNTVTSADVDGTICTSTGAGCLYNRVQEEGTNVTQRPTLNFIGSSITCADNAGSTRTDCTVTDANTTAHGALTGLTTGDDHTQYALLAGRTTSTNNLTLSSNASGAMYGSGVTTGSLTLRSNSVDTTTGSIFLTAPSVVTPNALLFDPDSSAAQNFVTYSDGTETVSNIWIANQFANGTYTVNTNTAGIIGFNLASGMIIDYSAVTNPVFGSIASTFNASEEIRPTGGAAVSGTWATPYVAAITFNPTNAGTVMTVTDAPDYESAPIWKVTSSGAFGATASRIGFRGKATVSSGTMLNYRGFVYEDKTGAGTITTQIGLDIRPLTAGTSANLGIRNAASTAFTSGTTQSIASGGATTIVASATFVKLDYPTGGAVTVSSTPTIADSVQDGIILILMNVDSADTITLKDEAVAAGSNLRLPSHVNYAMAPRDTLTLMWSNFMGDWITIASSHN